jgi:hypothetical protein
MLKYSYDFEGTVKWFAERADVILLFFDPDKPVCNFQYAHKSHFCIGFDTIEKLNECMFQKIGNYW